MQTVAIAPAARGAIVACHPMNARDDRYLRLTDDGAASWEDDPTLATAFESMREATRAALRLPGAVRAYSLPHPAAARHTVGNA